MQKSQMTNENNLIYYGDIYFWSKDSIYPDKLQVIMDTGSSWLWVPSSICSGCTSDSSLEHSFLQNNGEGVKTINYGSGSISGDIVRGKVSLGINQEETIISYKMLEVTSAYLPGLEGSKWDGILGLLPSAISGSELFVTELFKSGIIEENSFGVYLSGTSSGSQITFGGYDKTIVSSVDSFTFIPINKEYQWSVNLKHSKYGNSTFGGEQATSAILDSGTSLILMPDEMFQAFQVLISKGKNCGNYGVYYGCYCKSEYDFDPLFFLLENYEYKVSQENYIVQVRNQDQNFCYFLSQSSSIKKNSVLLGDSFLRNYYVYHDVTGRRMGLYGAHMVYFSTEIFTENNILFIACIISGIIMFCIISSILYCCCCCSTTKSQEKQVFIRPEMTQSDAPLSRPKEFAESKHSKPTMHYIPRPSHNRTPLIKKEEKKNQEKKN